jgi:ribonuclease HIII
MTHKPATAKTTPPASPDAPVGPRIGTDEAGKGDYFGHLVVAAVHVEPGQEESLRALGVRDSKRMADSVARRLAGEIKARAASDVVRISPRRYNELYAKLRNLNHLLAWAHARAIENLLARAPAPLVISDQFGDEQWLRQALMRRGRHVLLVQTPRAEQDLAVAAASVLARAAFLEGLEALSARVGLTLPKGATHVTGAARQIWLRGGEELLGEVAKLHFRVTQKLRQGEPGAAGE